MRAECPVCESALDGAVTHCRGCGYPTSLSARLGEGSSLAPASTPAGPAVSGPNAPTPAPSGATAAVALAETTAREVHRKAEALARLGADTSPVASSLCEAMTQESTGQIDRAVEILRSADQEADASLRSTVRARVDRLKQRRSKLTEAGVELPPDPTSERLEGALPSDDPAQAAELLREGEEKLATVEGQWHGLEQVFQEVSALRALASKLGLSVEGVPSRVEESKRLLASGQVRADRVARVARETTEELELLGRALAPHAEAELGRLGEMLKTSPDDPAERNRARAIRGRAARDLASGHLADVLRAVEELRALLPAKAAGEGGAVSSAPTGPAAGVAELPSPAASTAARSDVSVDTLLAKARGFAVKVRSLPPDSEAGRQAAAQIKEAAELLRQGRLVEADQALTRLMRTLASPGGTN